MLKTWSFWKTFFTYYLALVAGIWGFVEASTYFAGDSLKQLLGPNWWVLYYVLPLLIAFVAATQTNAKEETQAETLDQRNRRVMLNHVEEFWVKGILEKSLHGAALLELGIKEDPGAVRYPWTIKKEPTNETLPAGKSMLAIFQEIGLGRSLLILGAPGSGKTTMLLEFTRQWIERAREDETEAMPVVFNLASWREKQALADWLAEQLNIVYYVPKKTALAWVNEDRMLLLLDGLDEVKGDRRVECVEAINQFREEHGLTSLVVCSRTEEYSILKTKLSLEGAITIQPLSSKQINAYFERFGKSLNGIKQLLKKDKALQELAKTPLMLSIMTLAYRDRKADELIASKNFAGQRKHLFDTYIDRMFERPTRMANSSFTKTQALHYLSWLARKMMLHNIITYQIETMQPSWLEDDNKRRTYKWFVGLTVGLTFALSFGLLGGLFGGLIDGLIYGLSGGLVGGGLLGRLFGEATITMVDKLRWSWRQARRLLIIGMSGGLLVGLIAGLSFGLRGGLLFGLFNGLFGGLIFGLSGEQIEETTHPGQRLRQSLFNAIWVVVSIGLFFGLLSGLGSSELLGVLFFGLSFGLLGGLIYGILALIQHFALRFILIKDGFLPRSLISFLEYAVDLIFLRRVGGSYIFVHRTLMEHFAEMEA